MSSLNFYWRGEKMKSCVRPCIVMIAVLFLLAGPLHAIPLNGDFSAGLDGWSFQENFSDVGSSASISPENGQAKLTTAGIDSGIYLITLFQEIAIPSLATTLSFDVKFESANTDIAPILNSFVDFFQISYLDDDPSSGYDYYGPSVDTSGAYDPNSFQGLPISPVNGWYHFAIDIASLSGRTGALNFDLWDGDDGYYSTAWIDNVTIDGGQPSPVPEPGTLLLLGCGMAALGFLGKNRSSKNHLR